MGILERFTLKGRTALVTGAGRGIGRGLAHALAEAGADVAAVDINAESAQKVAGEIQSLGRRSIAISADVTKAEDARRMVETIVNAWDRLDIAVNNAGVGSLANAEDMSEAEWDRVVDINLKGVFLCCQAEARVMIPRKYGKIINTASISAQIVNWPQKQCAYNASKAGVVQLTRSLALEWCEHGICVNCISPGYTKTDLIGAPEFAGFVTQWLADIPVGHMAEITDLQGAIIYLASEVSDYVIGHDLVIDGGFTLP